MWDETEKEIMNNLHAGEQVGHCRVTIMVNNDRNRIGTEDWISEKGKGGYRVSKEDNLGLGKYHKCKCAHRWAGCSSTRVLKSRSTGARSSGRVKKQLGQAGMLSPSDQTSPGQIRSDQIRPFIFFPPLTSKSSKNRVKRSSIIGWGKYRGWSESLGMFNDLLLNSC